MAKKKTLFGILIVNALCALGQEIKLTHHDSLVRNFVVKEWNIKKEATISQVDLDLSSKKDYPYKEITLQPDGYKFRLYDFLLFHDIRPFVIEVTDSNNGFVTFFTFSDEYYYFEDDFAELKMSKKVSGKIVSIKINENPKRPTYPKNLEKNLNELIKKLGYRKDDGQKIRRVFEIIFINLLEMERFSIFEWRHLNAEYLQTLKSRDEKVKAYLTEYRDLEKTWRDGKYYLPLMRSKEGYFGYWIFDLNETGYIKVKFVSELLFRPF